MTKKMRVIAATIFAGVSIFSASSSNAQQMTGAGIYTQPSIEYQIRSQQQIQMQNHQRLIERMKLLDAMRQQRYLHEQARLQTLNSIDAFGQKYGRVISRSLIGCGTAGAAVSVTGPVGAGVACVGGGILAN